jgi:hypothetical protein
MRIIPEGSNNTMPPPDIKLIATRIFSASGWLLIGLVITVVGAIAYSRAYLGFGTETDFLGIFLIDAVHFQRADPLVLEFHPPFYPIVLACFQWLLDDWFVTGRIVSFVASASVVIASYCFFRDALSKPAALGAVVALAVSPTFLTYSTLATSDVFFAALYCLSILAAFRAATRNSIRLWVLTGAVLGLALLSRTNAISLLLIIFIPLIEQNNAIGRRFRDVIAIVVGLAVPFVLWAGYAGLTGSPLAPSGTYVNLAVTFFPPEGAQVWVDSVAYAEETFDSSLDVLLHDPVRLFATYAKWLYGLPFRVTSSDGLFAYPFNLLVLPAFLYLFFSVREKWVFYALVIALGQIAVVNFKTFEARYYLFLIPLIGAAVGYSAERVFFNRRIETGTQFGRAVVRLVISALIVVSFADALKHGYERATLNDAELGEVLAAADKIMNPGSAIVARKANIAFYTDSKRLDMPRGSDIGELKIFLENQNQSRDVFIYFGSVEKKLRSEYIDLLSADFNVQWLRLEASSKVPGEWVLYRYCPPHSQAN